MRWSAYSRSGRYGPNTILLLVPPDVLVSIVARRPAPRLFHNQSGQVRWKPGFILVLKLGKCSNTAKRFISTRLNYGRFCSPCQWFPSFHRFAPDDTLPVDTEYWTLPRPKHSEFLSIHRTSSRRSIC